MNSFSNINNFFRALHSYSPWKVALELLLIGLCVHYVLQFLRGTRGARMLRGIALVLITLYLLVQLGATGLGLTRLAFLYSEFLRFAFFAVIVVFQPELRRALLRLGETRLFRGWSDQMQEEIDALVGRAEFFSR